MYPFLRGLSSAKYSVPTSCCETVRFTESPALRAAGGWVFLRIGRNSADHRAAEYTMEKRDSFPETTPTDSVRVRLTEADEGEDRVILRSRKNG